MEVELKLLIEPRHIEALRQLPLLLQYASAPPRTVQMADIYFDTPALAIRNSHAGLRVREIDGAWIQTLKGGGSVASGLHSRYEWESTVAGPQPELDALRKLVDPHSAWARLLREPGLDGRLEKAFTTTIRRTIWDVRLPQGDLVEFALDEGSIACRDQTAEVSEIELELKSGAPEQLFDFALKLMDYLPLRLSNSSKAARGYGMYQPQPASAVRARPVRLARALTVEEGFRVIVANCLAQVQDNEAAVRAGRDPEAIHQMRVGLRRLRSALKLFKNIAPCPPELRAELSWLGDELGQARDWEVLLEATLPRLAAALPEQTATLESLKQACEKLVHDKHRQAADAIASPRFARLTLAFGAWLTGKRWRGALPGRRHRKLQAPLTKFSRQVLARDQAALLRRGRGLAHADPAARHRLRIAAKKTRYASEFFQSLYPRKRIKAYVKTLAELQDALGWLNDAAVADRLLAELQHAGHAGDAGDPSSAVTELAGAAAFARGYLSAVPGLEQPELLKLWKRFAGTRPPRRQQG